MNRDKKLAILLPVLVLIAIAVWIPNFIADKGVMQSRQDEGSQQGKELLETLLTTQPPQQKRMEGSSLTWGQNPFFREEIHGRKEEVSKDPTPEMTQDVEPVVRIEDLFVLKGTFWNEKKPSALINDEVVGIGMKIGVYTVVDIKENQVILNDGVLPRIS